MDDVPYARRNLDPSMGTSEEIYSNGPQSSTIADSTFRDNTHIHQGHIFNIYKYSDDLQRLGTLSLVPNAPASKPESIESNWLHASYERESRRSRACFLQCHRGDHMNDEYLNGFIRTKSFQDWSSTPGSVIWCRLGIRENCHGHENIAACALRQVISSLDTEFGYVFSYIHSAATELEFPEDYIDAKATALGKRLAHIEPKEIIMLSFVMQAKAHGLPVALESIDFTNPSKLIDSLTHIFLGALRRLNRRAIIIMDRLDADPGIEGHSGIIEVVSILLVSDVSHKISVVLSGSETPQLTSLLTGYTWVRSDSERQECLNSLQFSGSNVRRDEIVDDVHNSNDWIWSHKELKDLITQDSGAFAVIGKAGSGKSVLAKTIQRGIVHQLEQASQYCSKPIVGGWFYCRRKGEMFTAYLSLLRSLLFELLAKDSSLFEHFREIYRKKSPLQMRSWSIPELEQIFRSINDSGIPLIMVFDGIDEAEDDKIVGLVESLVETPSSRLKVILLSRPTYSFDKPYWRSRQIILQQENGATIAAIIADGLKKLQRILLGVDVQDCAQESDEYGPVKNHSALKRLRRGRRTVPPSVPPTTLASPVDLEALGANMRSRAKGVILWVVLVFDFLYKVAEADASATVEQLLSCLDGLPPEIDDFYGQMIEALTRKVSQSALRTARKALMWINVGSQTKQFTIEELWDALAVPSEPVEVEIASGNISIVNRRIAIRSWDDFNHVLRRLCGSLIEIIPVAGVAAAGEDDDEISGSSVVQLMHQTVKDFLATSPLAGPLSFTEEEAINEVYKHCQSFVKLALPGRLDTIIPFDQSSPDKWPFYIAQFVRYLDEFRLLPFCCEVLNEHPERLAEVQAQMDLKWKGFLPQWLGEQPQELQKRLVINWRYDHGSDQTHPLTSAALCVAFQFACDRALGNAVRNLLGILGLGLDPNFLPVFRDAILNAAMFTLLDHYGHPRYAAIRSKLMSSNRRQSAVLAIDDRLYQDFKCSELCTAEEIYEPVATSEIYAAIDDIVETCIPKEWHQFEKKVFQRIKGWHQTSDNFDG